MRLSSEGTEVPWVGIMAEAKQAAGFGVVLGIILYSQEPGSREHGL